MNDRELLELAAKAAGDVNFDGFTFMQRSRYSTNVWDPLHDDGDAFRLAVSLKMQLVVHKDWVEVLIGGVQYASPDACYSADGCMRETARRAIVRAAAAIGAAL